MEEYTKSEVGFFPSRIIKDFENPGKKETDAKAIFNRPVYQMRGTNNGKKKQIDREFENYSCEQQTD